MTEVTFVDSVQGHQLERLREIADRLRAKLPDVVVRVVDGDAAKGLLRQHKLNFGPALLIDGRLEYVGVPRWRFLQERIAQVAGGIPNPRTAAPPAPPAGARPTASPKPAAPESKPMSATPPESS